MKSNHPVITDGREMETIKFQLENQVGIYAQGLFMVSFLPTSSPVPCQTSNPEYYPKASRKLQYYITS